MKEINDELSINTAPVSIDVVSVAGKQMTLSVFKQIITEKPFDDMYNFSGSSWLGTVNYKGSWLIWIKGNYIRRYNLNNIELPCNQINNSIIDPASRVGLGISLQDFKKMNLTAISLVESWIRYANSVIYDSLLRNTMLTCLPTLIDKNTFEVVVNNPIQQGKIEEYSKMICNQINTELSCNISINLRVAGEQYSPKNKKQMIDHDCASLIQKMRQKQIFIAI